jgi:hypothetical protein
LHQRGWTFDLALRLARLLDRFAAGISVYRRVPVTAAAPSTTFTASTFAATTIAAALPAASAAIVAATAAPTFLGLHRDWRDQGRAHQQADHHP